MTLSEKRRREEAIAFASASLELSGFVVSDEAREKASHFIAGEIDLAEFVAGTPGKPSPHPAHE